MSRERGAAPAASEAGGGSPATPVIGYRLPQDVRDELDRLALARLWNAVLMVEVSDD